MPKKKGLTSFLISFFLLFHFILTSGQQLNYPLNFRTTQQVNFLINKSDSIGLFSVKPVSENYLHLLNISDSILINPERDKNYLAKHKANWLYRKLRKEDFIDFKTEGFRLRVNPLFHFEYKKTQNIDETYYTNTRGIEFKGDIGQKFSFYSSFYENQSRFVDYISDYVMEHRVVPGQGAAKILNNNKYDYSRASAYMSVSPNRNFNIQAGHSKHFIGEGYRSLLLSDNSSNYPFIKFSIEFGQFQYLVLWNQYQLFEGAYYNYHYRKYGAINFLSWSPKPGFELALFEGVTWPGNTADNPHKFTANFFNPLILFRTFQYGLNAEQNVGLGLNLRKRIGKFEQFYGQIVLDDLKMNTSSKNKYGFQLGIKSFDLFRDKLTRQQLFVLAEYNQVAPYTYTYEDPLQSYSHDNQPLAHPAGAGLKELTGIVNYQFRDLYVEFKMNHLLNSIDTLSSNFGSNIFLPDDGTGAVENQVGQGIKNTTQNMNVVLGLLINPVTNMKIYIEIQKRTVENAIRTKNKLFFSFGLKTNLNNYYYDF
ncbi:MAG: hypothetical protein ABFS35_18625 [Bacteroidota bacterium]